MSNSEEILASLGPLLSPRASIILPNHPEFVSLTARWRDYEAPNIAVVVKIADEFDVQQTVSVWIYNGVHLLTWIQGALRRRA